ncbi:hypothetical protein QFC20_003334 [Naganishia adeliensis]|uniref:Uncharacterized protein n=1 Tax=Naganishia adeliensis TaxID=92952 RepID=A0ACC2WB51_9TREE|nr:hypothetical protein QFC20_003334 [Naganishia adeliensis]
MAAAPPLIGLPAPPRRRVGVTLHKFQPGPGHGPVLSYLNAAMLPKGLDPHPLLACEMWDPKPWPKYLAWNVIEHPAYAVIWVDEEAQETELVGERDHPATSPRVEELYCCHPDSGWCVRVRNRGGVTLNDVMHAIFEFFASPLYVDELKEMHPRAVRIMEQRYFEQRAMLGGMAPGAGLFDGYRKADALLGKTFFAGLRWEPGVLESRFNLRQTNCLVLYLDNC